MAADVSIPKRARYKSSEVCSIAGVQPYILRSWEAEFPTLAKARTKTGVRVYRLADVEFVLQIKSLVFTDGLTLGAARRRLDTAQGAQSADPELEGFDDAGEPVQPEIKERLESLKKGLQGILDLLAGNEASSEAKVAPAPPPAPSESAEITAAPETSAETTEAVGPQSIKETPSEQEVS